MKEFLPKVCECGTKLTIEYGKKKDVIKLVCPNKECSCSILKKLQKGIIALEIRDIGSAVIEKLSLSGIESSLDLFDKSKFNEETLCASGNFVKGRALEKILNSVNSVKEIPIQKAILSLQLKDIGKTFSEKIGKIISGMIPDLTGLQLDIREELESKSSKLYTTILDAIKKFEDFGVRIVRYEKQKKVEVTQKITKSVAILAGKETIISLGWNIVDVKDPSCQMLIVENKDDKCAEVEYANTNNIKIMTLKQVNLLFG